MFEPYRPRRPTRAENEKDEEGRVYKRKKLASKKQYDRQRLEKRSSKMNYSELNGVGYQDFTLGPSSVARSRTQLDRRAYDSYRSQLEPNERPFLDSVPSLADCCLDLVAENYGEPRQLAALDSAHHLAHVKPLFDRVKGNSNADSSALPFEFWLEFALEFGLDLPNRFKTYKGLVASGDTEELELIKEYNAEAARNWIREPSVAPSFFLAILDLSNDTSFTDADIYKLRNPLSSFLAVLKLDGTSITDVGIGWIARAASEPEAYKHLEVLSLKGLLGVTNEGTARLSKLQNLRALDLRNTRCTYQVASIMNSSGVSPSFGYPRARKDLRQTLIEFQLFGGSLSPARTLSTLHHLAQIHHAPIESLNSILHCAPPKQLSIHISAMTRRYSSSLSSTNRSIGGQADKTPQELYQEQLQLSGFSGSAMATHHASFGTLTSTVSLARKLVEDDGRALGDKGAAFRTGPGDQVAAGEFVGQGRTGGRASLYEAGTRKFSPLEGADKGREPLSDTEDEAEKEKTMRDREAEEFRIWEEKTRGQSFYYAGREPVPKPERVIVAAEQSKLTLLRHLPFVPPYERHATAATVQEETSANAQQALMPVVAQPGGTLLKKKRKVDSNPSLSRTDSSSSSSPAAATTPRPRPFVPPSLSSRSTQPPTPIPPCAQRSAIPLNPFSKKPKASSARTDRKNIVNCTATLVKRSSLSAFKR